MHQLKPMLYSLSKSVKHFRKETLKSKTQAEKRMNDPVKREKIEADSSSFMDNMSSLSGQRKTPAQSERNIQVLSPTYK